MKNEVYANIAEIVKVTGVPRTTVHRKLKRCKIRKPYPRVEVDRLFLSGGDEAPVDIGELPTLEQLEGRIRRVKSGDDADLLSKQVRALKVLQGVAARDSQLMNTATATDEVRAVIALARGVLLAAPKAIAAQVSGLEPAAIESVLEHSFRAILAELHAKIEGAIK